MKTIRALLIATLCTIALGGLARADSVPTLTLAPFTGAITGAPGTTLGWGFTLSLGANFAVVTSSDFCVGAITSPCSNSLGTYTDFAGPQFIVVGPSSNVTQAFDNTLLTGIGSFLINPGATGSVFGNIMLTYDLFSVDPNSLNFNPATDLLSAGNSLMDRASVTVSTQAVPEPGSLLLLASGLAGLLFAKKKSARGNAMGIRQVSTAMAFVLCLVVASLSALAQPGRNSHPKEYSFRPIAKLGDNAPGGGMFINDFEPYGIQNNGEPVKFRG